MLLGVACFIVTVLFLLLLIISVIIIRQHRQARPLSTSISTPGSVSLNPTMISTTSILATDNPCCDNSPTNNFISTFDDKSSPARKSAFFTKKAKSSPTILDKVAVHENTTNPKFIAANQAIQEHQLDKAVDVSRYNDTIFFEKQKYDTNTFDLNASAMHPVEVNVHEIDHTINHFLNIKTKTDQTTEKPLLTPTMSEIATSETVDFVNNLVTITEKLEKDNSSSQQSKNK